MPIQPYILKELPHVVCINGINYTPIAVVGPSVDNIDHLKLLNFDVQYTTRKSSGTDSLKISLTCVIDNFLTGADRSEDIARFL